MNKREIKFRVFEKERNIMHYISDVGITNYCIMIDLEGNIFDISNDRYDFGNVNDEFILMQYIGLKDKNGKEIYEDDVLKFPQGLLSIGMGNHENIFVIDDKQEKLVSEYGVSAVGWVFPEELSLCEITDCEIIGNIHENPELMEKNNVK